MTTQFPDILEYNDKEYAIIDIKGFKIFIPTDYGLKPVRKCSACRRGYVCYYKIQENILLFEMLKIHLDNEAPSLFGIEAIKEKDFINFDAVYSDLYRRIEFTGVILIATEFINKLYALSMGFYSAWKFKEVLELNFDKGNLIDAIDCSSRFAQIRHNKLKQSNIWCGF